MLGGNHHAMLARDQNARRRMIRTKGQRIMGGTQRGCRGSSQRRAPRQARNNQGKQFFHAPAPYGGLL